MQLLVNSDTFAGSVVGSRANLTSVAIRPLLREGKGNSHACLHIAASSYIWIMVFFPSPTTTILCIDYSENLVDLVGSLKLKDGHFLNHAYTHII